MIPPALHYDVEPFRYNDPIFGGWHMTPYSRRTLLGWRIPAPWCYGQIF